MFYGFLAAWLIVLLYVVSLARRSARLKKELEDVRQLVRSTLNDHAMKLGGHVDSQ